MIQPNLSHALPPGPGKVHFVGIGGSGMNGIAELFLAAGHSVSGSDIYDSDQLSRLRQLGAVITIGHDASLLGNASALVFTGALSEENPEYQLAIERGLPVLHRSQALASLAQDRRTVAVAGSNGKTTSTGMIVTGLRELGADPTFVNGGVIATYGTSAGKGEGDIFVLEADESDGSFLLYDKAVALITGLDTDHLDYYGDMAKMETAFLAFARRASDLVIASIDNPAAARIAKSVNDLPVLTFGYGDAADIKIVSVNGSESIALQLAYAGVLFSIQLRVPGVHNAQNAAGAFAVLVGLGYEPHLAAQALEKFEGTRRRFDHRATVRGVKIYDDIAHHPTKVEAALLTARSVVGSGRIIAIHQPHLYSRTRSMAAEFARKYERLADFTVVLDVMGAREKPVAGVTGALIADQFVDQSRVSFMPEWHDAVDLVAAKARRGDIVMTVSGYAERIIPQLIRALEESGV